MNHKKELLRGLWVASTKQGLPDVKRPIEFPPPWFRSQGIGAFQLMSLRFNV